MVYYCSKLIIHSYFGIYGIICGIASFSYLVFEEDLILQPFRSLWLYLIILVITAVVVWYREIREVSDMLGDFDIRITVKFGNIFFSRNRNIFIPINSRFRSSFGNNVFVSTKSIQGQAIKKFYSNEPKRLDAQLQSLIKERNSGITAPFPPGFTLVDKIKKNHNYFVVTAEVNDKGASSTSEEFVIQALENFWNFLDDNPSNDLPLSLPLVGCGQGRLIKRQEIMMRNIFQSFITHIRRTNISPIKELIVYIPFKSLFQCNVDILKIKQFIGYICSEPIPDKHFSSRGLEG